MNLPRIIRSAGSKIFRTSTPSCIFRLAAIPILAFIIIPSCSGPATEEIPESDIAAIRSYADPATETTLQGLSAGDREQYSKYFNKAMKEAVSVEAFDKLKNQLNTQLGPYVSKEFRWIEKKNEYIIVHYRAKYSRGEVGIRMVFDKDNLVAGQWFE